MAFLQKIDPRRLFLMDSCGAAVSALLPVFVLAHFESVFGIPNYTLYQLACIPAIFAVYSFLCYWYFPNNWPLLMRVIAVANSLYAIGTLVWLTVFNTTATTLGSLYFILEVMIIAALVVIELKIAARKRD